jgi:hypothetical protein
MQITITRRMAVSAVAALALIGAGGAIAASGHSSGSSTASSRQTCGPGPGLGPRADSINAVATYLGVTKAELRTAHENGTSLAQLATQQGKSVDGLKQAMLADAKTHLDQAVKDGMLTQAQATQELNELRSRIDQIVTGTFRGPGEGRMFRWRGGPPGDAALLPPAA